MIADSWQELTFLISSSLSQKSGLRTPHLDSELQRQHLHFKQLSGLMETCPLKEEITSFFQMSALITQRQEGRETPSGKIVLKEERGNSQASSWESRSQNKKSVYLGKYLVMIHLTSPLLFQTAACTEAGSDGLLFSKLLAHAHTSLKPDGWLRAQWHLCSLLPAKDWQRALLKSLQGLCCHSPESVVYSLQSSPCHNPALSEGPNTADRASVWLEVKTAKKLASNN